MDRNSYPKELERMEADRLRESEKENEKNPLAKYSTNKLKAELRRRKQL